MARRSPARYQHPGLLGLGAAAFFVLMMAPASADLVASGGAGTITVTSPGQDGWTTTAPTATIEGVLSDPSATLALNGVLVPVGPSGAFSRSITLAEGLNVVRLSAATPGGSTQLAFRLVRDDVPPALAVFSPGEGASLSDDRASVYGQAEPGSEVTVNGRAAEVNAFDGSFAVSDLTLPPTGSGCLQSASITVLARDRAGNLATVTRTVTTNQCFTHPRLAAPIPALEVGAGQVQPLAIDLASYFADDGGAGNLIFSTYVTGPAASALAVSYSPGALSLHWLGPAFAGASSLSITARDRDGEVSDAIEVPLTVLASPSTNRAPAVTLPGLVDALPAGGALTFVVAVSDPDGDAVDLSVQGEGAGARVVSISTVDSAHFAVRVAADPGALSSGGVRFAVTARDPHFAASEAVLTIPVYDAGAPVGLAVASPADPEVAASSLSTGPSGESGLAVELSSSRRVGHLYLSDPRTGGAKEVPALNDEHTYWRVFVPLPTAPGVYVRSVWASDPGLAPQEQLFSITVLPDPAAPSIVRIVSVAGTPEVEEGQPVSLTFVGGVADPAATAFEWRVDGEVVGRGAMLEGIVLDAGTHAVTLKATSPGGSSSASTSITVSPRAGPVLPGRATPWLFYFGIAGLVVVGLILGGTEIGIYFLFTALLGAIIDRETREKLLTHFVRGRIYQIIEYEPGVHLSELQRKAGVARGVCAYHLHALEKAGLVKTMRDGMFLRFFATKVKIDAEAYALAADDREVLRAIEARPGITEREVAEMLGKSSGVVARSVKTLAQSGYVEARREGASTQLYPRTQRGSAAAPSSNP